MADATVVLVHGAWHGAWCWQRLLPLLAEREMVAVTVDLPGHGSDPGPFTDLHGDADRVRQAIDDVGGPVVLVGHSYGGAVITEAGDHPNVRHLVYLAAFNIDETETVMTAGAAGPDAAAIDHAGRPDVASFIVPTDEGTATIAAGGAKTLFCNDCPEDADWVTSMLCPQPMVTLGQSPAAVAWRSKPSTYAICDDDAIVHPELQRILARRATHSVHWPTGHSPFLSRPDLVSDLLVPLTGRD